MSEKKMNKEKAKKTSKKALSGKADFSIRFKMNLAFLGVITLTLIILGGSVFVNVFGSMEDKLLVTSSQAIHETGRYIDEYMKNFEEKVKLAAKSDAILNGSSKTQNDVYPVLERLLENNNAIMFAYLGTSDKAMIMKPDAELPDGFDPTGRPWYTDAVSKGDFAWTDPYEDASTGEWVVTAAIPVMKNGRVTGVFGIDLSLVGLAEELGQIQIATYGYPVLVTNNGITMTHPNKELIGVEMPVKELLDAVVTGDTTAKKYKYGGKNKYGIFTRLNNVEWTVLAALDRSEVTDDTNKFLMTMVFVGFVTIAIAFVVSFLFSRSISNNIKVLMEGLRRIKDGDLTTRIRVKTRDEIGLVEKDLNETVEKLSEMMHQIQSISVDMTESSQSLAATAEETSASADEVAKTVEDIAKGASNQAQDAEGGVIIAKSLSDKFNELSEKSHSMISTAKDVMEANVEGVKAIVLLKEKTEKNDEANNRIEQVIRELDNKAQSIEAILNSISAIAVQTNLLALNASIEAARAGEHGRGFAVVAEEIRQLAEQSSKAAEEVREIVTNIQSDSTKTVTSMQDMKTISIEQSQAVVEVNKQFSLITESIDAISREINAISNYVDVLDDDKEAIVSAIENISAVSEETAAAAEEVNASMEQQTVAVEEVAKAAERMNEISVILNDEVSKFKVD
ncbi:MULTISPECIES: methyl-accepting chemotaxis protein [unclassified Fusibacter]|uniref:methyl-accepting chemotaxis protein n=1 Tax=unclassified Fusibacter TaxID=2624464 RepID=UPI0010118A1B|nr:MULTISPECIES: methyl-accepting chemotaxis protein [unclassified Fusibacter]MCK8061402.1 methyl-accepting chemotaxis protein [Fusibacter sp. A2]NPE23555.1 HAMP domain-containing protein [Fusibacter sp. A1]RXV58965.1 methyl-accepting chemotaxis protein [Fusibacter sp. A1]